MTTTLRTAHPAAGVAIRFKLTQASAATLAPTTVMYLPGEQRSRCTTF